MPIAQFRSSINKEKSTVAQRCKPISKEQTRKKDEEKKIRGAKAMGAGLINSQQGHRRYEHGEDDLDGQGAFSVQHGLISFWSSCCLRTVNPPHKNKPSVLEGIMLPVQY